MGGHVTVDMPAAVSAAGGLDSFPSALLTPEQLRDAVGKIRAKSAKPLNLNFFCNAIPLRDETLESAWRQRLAPYYAELGVDLPASPANVFMPFGAEMCDTAVDLKPDVVSFHFGLPEKSLVDRIKAAGCMVFSSATTVAEARWLEDHGADAVIAQGIEAGGHRGMFLTADVASQVGTLALVPQVVDAVRVPVIAAGGRGRAGDCGGARVGRLGRADGHGLLALPRGAHHGFPQSGSQVGRGQRDRHHQRADARLGRVVGPLKVVMGTFSQGRRSLG